MTILAPATTTALDIARALHDEVHESLTDPGLSASDRLALVEWHLAFAEEYGPDFAACETFGMVLATWRRDPLYARALVALLDCPDRPAGRTRQEAEADLRIRRPGRRTTPRRATDDGLAEVIPLRRRHAS